jgi:molybdopterin-guanine dinucleotide biosynthesis protein A
MTLGSPPLYGLVLAGGRSTRMQRDKATIQYRPGESQLDATMKLLEGRVARLFLSVREDQVADPARARHPRIVDRGGIEGPIAGIRAAMQEFPEAAWLVVACDLPFLDPGTLDELIAARATSADATAFRSSHDALPEPLCAIYEPRARTGIDALLAGGRNCPRKFLINANTHLLDQPNPRALDNVNTVAEYAQAMSSLHDSPAASRRIRVQYYAILREQAGRSDETLDTQSRTPRELYQELAARYRFTLPADLLRVAVNSEFGDWGQPLQAGDSVVFIPPVAGG